MAIIVAAAVSAHVVQQPTHPRATTRICNVVTKIKQTLQQRQAFATPKKKNPATSVQ